MQITYDPTTMEVISHKIGCNIECPEGLETAWCEWPAFTRSAIVVSAVDKQAEIEVTGWWAGREVPEEPEVPEEGE
jgi:hypothetical protein